MGDSHSPSLVTRLVKKLANSESEPDVGVIENTCKNKVNKYMSHNVALPDGNLI